MDRRICGMKLGELAAVTAIIVLLIAFLLPTISAHRSQVRAVTCTANLKKLCSAIFSYCALNDNWILPALLNGSDGANNRWYGAEALGPNFGSLRNNPDSAGIQQTINKILDCPAVNHPQGSGPASEGGNGNWAFDYSYNQALGSNSAPKGLPPDLLFPFVKQSQIRPEVLLVAEVRDTTSVHDYLFNSVTPSLVPTSKTNSTDGQAIAGTPHAAGTKGNMLFNDGHIALDDPNKLLGPPPREWMVWWHYPKNGNAVF